MNDSFLCTNPLSQSDNASPVLFLLQKDYQLEEQIATDSSKSMVIWKLSQRNALILDWRRGCDRN